MNSAEDQTSSIPESWMMKTIGDLASYVRGVTYDKSLSRTSPAKGYTPLLRATNIDSGALILEDFVYVPEDIVKAEQLLKIGDLVIAASSGSSSVVGKSAPIVTDFSGTFGAFCAVLRADLATSNKYLGYYIQSPSVRELWSSLARGTNINNLKRDQVCSTPIAVPPRNEQDEIVRILEEQFSRLDAAAASIAAVRRKAEQFRRSFLYRVFHGSDPVEVGHRTSTWPVKRLDEIAEVRLGRQRSPGNHQGSQMRKYLRAANVTWSGLDLSDVKEMNFTDEEMQTFSLMQGDLLVNEASGSASEVGKVCRYEGQIDECAFQNTLLRVRPSDVSVDFLYWFLTKNALTGAYLDDSRGVGIFHLGRAKLAGWVIPVPPAEDQGDIAKLCEQQMSRIERLLAETLRVESRLVTVRRSLLHAAFSGELTKEWREKNNG